MPKLRVLSGIEVCKILKKFGFATVTQKGSHLKLSRQIKGSEKQTLTIPNHEELDRGTLRAIFNQASRYVPSDELGAYFYQQ